MPTFRITSPEGKTYEVTGPEGSTAEQALAQVQASLKAESPGMLATLGGAAGKGLGDVVLGAQGLIGKGLSAVGAKTPGDWLQKDAAQGRAKLADELAPYKEANPVTAAVGETAGQIVGTIPAGAALGAGIKAAGLTRLGTAVGTAGMSTGAAPAATAGGRLADLAIRSAGGAINGAASAGLVDPEQAGTGAAIGGALPGALMVAGKAGNALGNLVRGPAQSADTAAGIAAARQAGYVIPPSQANPSLLNRAMEGAAGKITTAQNASAKNQAVTSSLAAKALGLPADTKITPEVLNSVRQEAGKVYSEVASLPARPAVTGSTLTNTPAAAEINPAAMVFDLRKARNDATAWFTSYGRTADPDALVKAKAAAAQATKLEKGLEDYAASLGRDDLVPALRDARQLIAKTYSVEKALNPTTGTVDARALAAQLKKGKPLSGELKDAAEFAARFPKAAQPLESMGSLPQTSPLDLALFMGTSNPMMMLARPAARTALLSGPVQNRLVQDASPNALQRLAANPALAQAAYRAAPVAAADR